jgi:hypothetical protein
MWWLLGIYLATAALSYLLTPRPSLTRPQPQQRVTPQPQSAEPPDAATAGAVPVVFGRCWVRPNVVWYGDTGASEIKQCETVVIPGRGGKK